MKKKTFLTLALCAVTLCAVAQESAAFRITKNLGIFNDVMRQLDLYYVDTLNYDNLTLTAVNALLRKVDPYTVYIPEEDKSDLDFLTTGSYGGIGSMVSLVDGRVCISDPYEGKPAQVAGLRAGDVLLDINGQSCKNKSVAEVSKMLRGKPHDKIKIRVERYGEKKPLTFEFERKQIQINPVTYAACVAPGVGFIQFSEFIEGSAGEFRTALTRLAEEHGISRLIIDLRDNGGGLMEESVRILSFFLPKNTVVTEVKGRVKGAAHTYKTTTDPIYPDMQLAVLVNSSTASAAELLAGALQDMDRAVLIGSRTFGKGLVQNVLPISPDGHLKITTAKYYIPSGRCIQAIDYSHRNDDGSVGRVPDSLTHEFRTRAGRIVRDGGGVTPDIDTEDTTSHLGISYALYMQNMFFKYATRYAATHEAPASVEAFSITDSLLADFARFLHEEKFTYRVESIKVFNALKEMMEYEQLDSLASAELEALRLRLQPTIEQALEQDRTSVETLLGSEIVKRYFYEKGVIAYSLRTDTDLKQALRVLQDESEYRKLLAPGK